MKLAAVILSKAIEDRDATKSRKLKMEIADRWFEQNAAITLEEILKQL